MVRVASAIGDLREGGSAEGIGSSSRRRCDRRCLVCRHHVEVSGSKVLGYGLLDDPRRAQMLYQAYQAQADIMASLRGIAGFALQGFGQLRDCSPYLADSKPARNLEAGYALLGRVGLTHERAPWGIDTVRIGRRDVVVREEATDVQP